jgi:hypothetical protein
VRREPANFLPIHRLSIVVHMLGVLLTKWTIRLALVCYVAYLAGWLARWNTRRPRAARAVWTLGCVLFDVHVVCAFHFFHHWSHLAAWRNTAERTERLLGVAVGDGIYFSYLFLMLWILDVLWLWWPSWTAGLAAPGSRENRAGAYATGVPIPGAKPVEAPAWRVGVHVFLLFIAVNGAIVFEAGPTRWVGLASGLLLACLAVRHGYNLLYENATRCNCEASYGEMTHQHDFARASTDNPESTTHLNNELRQAAGRR